MEQAICSYDGLQVGGEDFRVLTKLSQKLSKQVTKDKGEIAILLQSYRNALVKSSTPDIIKLYTPDALLMAQGFPIVSGKESIRKWYDNCFKVITLDVEFEVKEIVITSDEFAFATTTSAGTQKDNASGKTSNEGNHELFVIQKVNGDWKLARYCFSTTKSA